MGKCDGRGKCSFLCFNFDCVWYWFGKRHVCCTGAMCADDAGDRPRDVLAGHNRRMRNSPRQTASSRTVHDVAVAEAGALEARAHAHDHSPAAGAAVTVPPAGDMSEWAGTASSSRAHAHDLHRSNCNGPSRAAATAVGVSGAPQPRIQLSSVPAVACSDQGDVLPAYEDVVQQPAEELQAIGPSAPPPLAAAGSRSEELPMSGNSGLVDVQGAVAGPSGSGSGLVIGSVRRPGASFASGPGARGTRGADSNNGGDIELQVQDPPPYSLTAPGTEAQAASATGGGGGARVGECDVPGVGVGETFVS